MSKTQEITKFDCENGLCNSRTSLWGQKWVMGLSKNSDKISVTRMVSCLHNEGEMKENGWVEVIQILKTHSFPNFGCGKKLVKKCFDFLELRSCTKFLIKFESIFWHLSSTIQVEWMKMDNSKSLKTLKHSLVCFHSFHSSHYVK